MNVTIQIPEENTKALYGIHHKNLKLFEDAFAVTITARGGKLTVEGEASEKVEKLIRELSEILQSGHNLKKEDFRTAVKVIQEEPSTDIRNVLIGSTMVAAGSKKVTPKSINQKKYLSALRNSDMVFGIGPAGTGKTYLAVAAAVEALLEDRIKRIMLARPAVEAGENLGFLPGDMIQKVDPYLRPLYDALYDLIDADKTHEYIEKGIIEIVPIAFMRGRTLNDSFVILDEAQNTTSEQMKMFLTRIGFNSKAAITGDITQIDLPDNEISGLVEVQTVLSSVDNVEFIYFDRSDVVRHNLVQEIIQAYENHKDGKNG